MCDLIKLILALVFPVIMLGALWTLGLDEIWLNMVGTSALAAVLSFILLKRVGNEIKPINKQR